MAVNRANEAKPISNVYYNVTLPAAYQKVTLVNGVPTSGTHLGALAAGIEWNPIYATKTDEVENYPAAIGADKDMVGLEMVVPLKEVNGLNLSLSSGGKLITLSDGTQSVRIGTGTALEMYSWLIVWERKAGTRIYEQAMVFQGYVKEAAKMPISSKEFTVLQVTIAGFVDTTRPDDDNLGYNTCFQ